MSDADDRISTADYVTLWREWNRLVWTTPIAFVGFLSAFAALAGSYLKSPSDEISSLVPAALSLGSVSLFFGAKALYRFALRRERVSAVLQLREQRGWETFRNWSADRHWRGLDFVAFLLYSFSFLFALSGAATLGLLWRPLDPGDSFSFALIAVVTVALSFSLGGLYTRQELRRQHKSLLKFEASCSNGNPDAA